MTSLFTIVLTLLLACMASCETITYAHDIRMDVILDFNIIYSTSLNHTETRTVSLSPDSQVTDGSVTHAEHWVEVKVSSQYKDTARFTFSYDSKDLLVLNLTYAYYEDANAVAIFSSVVLNLNIKKGSYESYFCQLPVTYTFTMEEPTNETIGDLSVVALLSLARIQAFGLVKDGFGVGVECSTDSHALVPGNYSIKDPEAKYPCVKFTSAIDVNIDYDVKSADGKKSAHVLLPEGTVLDPMHCVNVSQPLALSFYDGQFTLTITFNKTTDTNYNVFVSNMSLDYNITDALFPNTTSNGLSS